MKLFDYDGFRQRLTSVGLRSGCGASEAVIAAAERKLGWVFDGEFRRFLSELGWIDGRSRVYGVGHELPRAVDLVELAAAEWEFGVPANILAVAPDGTGSHYCLDTSAEPKLVYFDHETFEVEDAYDSFGHFLEAQMSIWKTWKA